MSENIKWRYRRKFEQGTVAINATCFMGYDKTSCKRPIMTVEIIFTEYLFNIII